MRRVLAPSTVLALVLVPMLCACEEDGLLIEEDEVCFVRRDGQTVCMETYEAARFDASADGEGTSLDRPISAQGVLPWTNITWSAALAACREKGKRLCNADEWLDACDGVVGESVGTVYTYGDERDPSKCNAAGGAVVATGSFPACQSLLGLFDMSGNVWEWTGNDAETARARGGSFRSSQEHRCLGGDATMRFLLEEKSGEVGFRCCRDG